MLKTTYLLCITKLLQEDVDSPDGDNSDDLVIANTCGALLQAFQSLVTVPIGDFLTPDKRFWVQSHIAMVMGNYNYIDQELILQ